MIQMPKKFTNNKEGRAEVVEIIGKLIQDGYSREDHVGQKVVLTKRIQKGKICERTAVKEFIFIQEEGKIELKESFESKGISSARSKLYGFAAPILEANNAVRSGLFSQDDYDILMMESDERWWKGEVQA